MVADGEEVTISAMVSDGSGGSGLASVMADVSMLDTGATAMVTLTDDDGDGTYTGMHDISTGNTADNGDAYNHRYRDGQRWQQRKRYCNR